MSLNPLLKFYTTLITHLIVQQYSFNPLYGKPALEKSNPKVRSFASYQKQKHTDIRRDSKSVCTSTLVLSADPVSYPINFFSYADTAEHSRGPQRP